MTLADILFNGCKWYLNLSSKCLMGSENIHDFYWWTRPEITYSSEIYDLLVSSQLKKMLSFNYSLVKIRVVTFSHPNSQTLLCLLDLKWEERIKLAST